MTRTCENLAEQDARGTGILPMDFLACFDWLDNATLIKHGFDPRDKEIPLDQRDTPQDIQPYGFTTVPETGDGGDGDNGNGEGSGGENSE